MSEAVNETAQRSLLLDEPGDLPCEGFTVGSGLGAHCFAIRPRVGSVASKT